ncbi:hypothetical protein BGZ82_004713, partial [Podila clonocystis]
MDSESLIKHSHHIHALTCTSHAKPALLKSSLGKLVKINFIRADDVYGSSIFVPVDMIRIIARAPRHRAVSIEDIHIGVYKGSRAMSEDYGERLARVNSSAITNLAVKSREQMSRSKRVVPPASGSGRQHRWPERERPLEQNYISSNSPRILPDVSPGRWEHEDRKNGAKRCPDALAVLENEGVLEVCLPPASKQLNTPLGLLDRYRALTKISVTDSTQFTFERRSALVPLSVSHPHLSELEGHFGSLQSDSPDRTLQWLLADEHVNLSSM